MEEINLKVESIEKPKLVGGLGDTKGSGERKCSVMPPVMSPLCFPLGSGFSIGKQGSSVIPMSSTWLARRPTQAWIKLNFTSVYCKKKQEQQINVRPSYL